MLTQEQIKSTVINTVIVIVGAVGSLMAVTNYFTTKAVFNAHLDSENKQQQFIDTQRVEFNNQIIKHLERLEFKIDRIEQRRAVQP